MHKTINSDIRKINNFLTKFQQILCEGSAFVNPPPQKKNQKSVNTFFFGRLAPTTYIKKQMSVGIGHLKTCLFYQVSTPITGMWRGGLLTNYIFDWQHYVYLKLFFSKTEQYF